MLGDRTEHELADQRRPARIARQKRYNSGQIAAGAIAATTGLAADHKNRTRRKTVLGVPLPRSVGKSITSLDGKSIAKSVGQASKRFAKTTKNVSKDLERAGDQAERIGKILD